MSRSSLAWLTVVTLMCVSAAAIAAARDGNRFVPQLDLRGALVLAQRLIDGREGEREARNSGYEGAQEARGRDPDGPGSRARRDPTASGSRPHRPTPMLDSEAASLGLAGPVADDAHKALTPVPPVDWPTLAELDELPVVSASDAFKVYAGAADDPLLTHQAGRWAPELPSLLARIEERTVRELPRAPVHVVFSRVYAARCPARGLATPRGDVPRIEVYVDETTTDTQIHAVLAHELAHHVTIVDGFVGDSVLSEGIANWSADEEMLAWQGIRSWDDAVRAYLADGSYVSITDSVGQSPIGGEDCLARRDRVYNVRTSFVSWLIERHGLDTVLAMPCRRVPTRTGSDGEVHEKCVPDYREATGYELERLEGQWLEEVKTG